MSKHSLLIFLSFALGCKPDKAPEETLTPANTDSTALAETVDSASNTRIDGTETSVGLPTDVKQQLPAELEVYLDRTHGLWQLPTLPQMENSSPEAQGSYFLNADFDHDKRADYAVQIIERDTVTVLALLQEQEEGAWKEFVLERNPLKETSGQENAPHLLMLANQKNENVKGAKQSLSTSQNGIAVRKGNSTTTYLFEKNRFRKLETGK